MNNQATQAKPKGTVKKIKNQLEFKTPFTQSKAPIKKRSKSCLPNQFKFGDFVEILQPAEVPLTTLVRAPLKTGAANRSISQAPAPNDKRPLGQQQRALAPPPVTKPQGSVARIRQIKDEELIPLSHYPPNFWENFAKEVAKNSEKFAALFFKD